MEAYNISPDFGLLQSHHCQVDPATGAIKEQIMKDSESRPTNLLFHDGKLYFVDGFTTGMLTSIDLEGNRSPVQQAIFAKYWGDFVGGRSFVKDMLTGTVYAIRDLRTEYYDGPGMSLCCAPSVWALPAPRRSADRHRTGSQQPVPEISAALWLQQVWPRAFPGPN